MALGGEGRPDPDEPLSLEEEMAAHDRWLIELARLSGAWDDDLDVTPDWR